MSTSYENRQFIVFNMTEIDKIDFTKVLETSADTIRKTIDGTKSFVKWDGENIPDFIETLTTKEGPYTYEEIMTLLATPEWTSPSVTL